ncbi:MAG: xanthine dehydrogenase accessory protein XdhC [Rhizobacter sp.]|nr:xanthine dehydrogenase accessory protein XdhC [Rhizobacter sp.]
MNREHYDEAATWLCAGRPAVVVEVAHTRGSVPREAGTRMVVAMDAVIGTVGGGHLELKAIEQARSMIASRAIIPQEAHYPLGPALGQCCGGAVTLGFMKLDDEVLAAWLGTAPTLRLQLHGAGHVGRAIARLLATLNVAVDWVDERDEEFPGDDWFGRGGWPAHIRRVGVDAVEAEVACAAPGTFYLVLTHNHDIDLRITEAVLRRGDFGFLGLIGSNTKKQRFIHRFEARGIDAAVIERMTCPIGVKGIDGKEPEVIAMAVVAQLLQLASMPKG